MIMTTKDQRKAIARVFSRRDPMPEHSSNRREWFQRYREFRKTAQGGPGCIMIQWCGMWLGIESDGYTHS